MQPYPIRPSESAPPRATLVPLLDRAAPPPIRVLPDGQPVDLLVEMANGWSLVKDRHGSAARWIETELVRRVPPELASLPAGGSIALPARVWQPAHWDSMQAQAGHR